MEALEFTGEQLRRLQEVSTRAGGQSRKRTGRHVANASHRENDQQVHHPRQVGPRQAPEAGR